MPLLCSALYQRHVWVIHQPVVGLFCSSTGTISTAIFGLRRVRGRSHGKFTIHPCFVCWPFLKPAADDRLDPFMSIFDFTDTHSAVCLVEFVLGLRSHFQDIKDVA